MLGYAEYNTKAEVNVRLKVVTSIEQRSTIMNDFKIESCVQIK